MRYLIQHGAFVIRFRYLAKLSGFFRAFFFKALGMRVGAGTVIPKLFMTWPHQVKVGDNCVLEQNIYFKYDGIWKEGPSIIIGNNVFIGTSCEFNINHSVTIGNDSLIASGCRFIDHDHGFNIGFPMNKQQSKGKEIKIGNDVWIGCNVVILKGVVIEDGAIIAAGAVLNKSVKSNEIWGGIPAKLIGQRK